MDGSEINNKVEGGLELVDKALNFERVVWVIVKVAPQYGLDILKNQDQAKTQVNIYYS